MKKLWAGRATEQVDAIADDFNSSIRVDSKMFRQDIQGSIAHSAMLAKCGIITPEEGEMLGAGLRQIAADIESGALEIDPKAEDIARENAAYNGFAAPAFTALTGNVTEDKDMMDSLCASEYDLVLVNIVADVIIGLSPVLPNFLTERSTLICSGILDVRLPDVLAALEAAGLTVTATYEKEDWRCVTAKKI